MHPHLPQQPAGDHVTTSFPIAYHPAWPHALLPAGPRWAQAQCRCGWTECAESRHDARILARHHRRFAEGRRTFLPGWDSTQGPRLFNADATAVHVDMTGRYQAWAVADGIGDDSLAAHTAEQAATTAVYAAATRGSVAGLLAAAEILDGELPPHDTVLAVATPHDGGGWDIAWVGDCRAYEYQPATGALSQLTTDHTSGQRYRDQLGALYTGRPDQHAIAESLDHAVVTSVATATPDTIGHVTTTGPRGRLLLTTDGIRKHVPHASLIHAARTVRDSRACAARLTLAARHHGTSDNAAALVVDPVPPRPAYPGDEW